MEFRLLRVGALFFILMLLGMHAAANTVHKVRFAQTGKVLVWMDGVLIGQGAEVSLGEARPPADPIFGNGKLDPEEPLSNAARHILIIKVASNTGFTIETGGANLVGEISVRVIEEGANAKALTRVPAKGSRRIFEQAGRTAESPGAPETQSLTLELMSSGRALDELIIRAANS